MRYPVSFVLALCILLPLSQVQAQVLPDPGARVRITRSDSPRAKVAGVLDRVTGDTLFVAGQPISRSSIGRLEVSEGRRSQWRKGLVFGFLAGAGAGALSSVILLNGIDWSDGNGSEVAAVAILAGIGGGAGLLVGGTIGAFTQGDRWRTVPFNRVRLAPIVRRDGALGISVGLAF